MRDEYRRQIPRFPNWPIVYSPPDRGARMPAVDWDNRWTYVRTGTNADGRPIVEAQRKPRPR